MEEPPGGDLLDPDQIIKTQPKKVVIFICCNSKQDFSRLIFS